LNGVSNAGSHKRTWIAGKNRPNGLGPGAMFATLTNRVLAPQTAARGRVAAPSCLETIAIERNTLGLGAATSRRIQLQRSNFQSRRAQKVELVKTLGSLGGLLKYGGNGPLARPAKVDVVLGTRESISIRDHRGHYRAFAR
jgi:hypothetical protein